MRAFLLLFVAIHSVACFDSDSVDEGPAATRLSSRVRPSPISAMRPRDQAWRSVARERLPRERDQIGSAHQAALSGHTTVVAPPSFSTEQLHAAFEFVRGTKFVAGKRRLPWMYPQDGCFARAARMNAELTATEYPAPAKIFAFGDLQVATRFDSSGTVYWWYHVAPLVAVDGVEYVLDPAVEPTGPLTRAEWEKRISSENSASCDPFTYAPDGSCAEPPHEDYSHIGLEESSGGYNYIELESGNLADLGLRAAPLLGDRPPWVTPHFGEVCTESKDCPPADGFQVTCSKSARIDGAKGCFYDK